MITKIEIEFTDGQKIDFNRDNLTDLAVDTESDFFVVILKTNKVRHIWYPTHTIKYVAFDEYKDNR